MIFDSHIHWHEFTNEEREKQNEIAERINLKKIAIPSASIEEWETILSFKNENIFVGIGIHPLYINDLPNDWYEKMDEMANNFNFIGEIGIDFYKGRENEKKQIEILKKQLNIAEKYDLPVIFHIRKGFDIVWEIIKNRTIRGIIHSVSGSYEQIMPFLKKGFGIGFTATVCNPHAKKIRKIASLLPVNRILIESDAPYQSIWYKKGEKNTIEVLPEIIRSISEIRECDKEELEEKIYEGSIQFFI